MAIFDQILTSTFSGSQGPLPRALTPLKNGLIRHLTPVFELLGFACVLAVSVCPRASCCCNRIHCYMLFSVTFINSVCVCVSDGFNYRGVVVVPQQQEYGLIFSENAQISVALFLCRNLGIAEFAGLENDGVEQEETYIVTAYDEVNAN